MLPPGPGNPALAATEDVGVPGIPATGTEPGIEVFPVTVPGGKVCTAAIGV